MAILEQVIRMKGQGLSDGDIVSELSQQGISPREINDALKQAQIKYAVSAPEEMEEMVPSILPEGEVPSPTEFNNQVYTPRTYEEQEGGYSPQESYVPAPVEYPQQGEQYYSPAEGGYEQYGMAGLDTSTVMEIADQVFSERIRKIQKQLDSATEISTLLQTKMENVSDRLKKVEAIIDKLQIAILEKVGSYGNTLESIKKEMSMMQDSFSKMISPRREKRDLEERTEEVKKRKVHGGK